MQHLDWGSRSGVTRVDWRRFRLPLVACLVVLLGILSFAGGEASMERKLSITLVADRPGGLQVFYDHGAGYTEMNSARVTFGSGQNRLTIPLSEDPVKALRLDPDPGIVEIHFQEISIEAGGAARVRSLPLHGLYPIREAAALNRGSAGVIARMVPGAEDPQFQLMVDDGTQSPSRLGGVARFSQVLLLLLLGGWAVCRLARSPGGVPVPGLLFGAWLLIAAMALTSNTNEPVHPDEQSHVAAAQYYIEHWRPPAVDAPTIAGSYSVYGSSYLNELDVVYLIATKATRFWTVFGLDQTISLRLFNVLLFGALFASAWVCRNTWPAAAVLLLTPQLWYVFSYFNADAFPIFLSLIAAMLYAAPDSPVSRYVEGGHASRWAVILFACTVGLLLVSKANYLPVVFVIGLALAVRHLDLRVWGVGLGAFGAALLLFPLIAGGDVAHMVPHFPEYLAPLGFLMLVCLVVVVLWTTFRRPLLRPRLYRLGALFALAIVVASPRVAADLAVNGPPSEKAARMALVAERLADPMFKPSTFETDPSESFPGLRLASRGVTLSQAIGEPYGWATNSWRSLLGVYGYMNIFAPSLLYWTLGGSVLFLLLGVLNSGLRHADAHRILAVSISGVALVALSSVVHSWANDFQAQGRYLFPALAIIGAYLMSQPKLLREPWIAIGVSVCFVVSALSFVGVAFPAMAGG